MKNEEELANGIAEHAAKSLAWFVVTLKEKGIASQDDMEAVFSELLVECEQDPTSYRLLAKWLFTEAKQMSARL